MPRQIKSYKANAAPLDVSHVKLRYEFPCWGRKVVFLYFINKLPLKIIVQVGFVILFLSL